MGTTLKILGAILGGFIVLFGTSFLYDLPIIADSWIRRGLVLLLLCLELVIAFYALKEIVKGN